MELELKGKKRDRSSKSYGSTPSQKPRVLKTPKMDGMSIEVGTETSRDHKSMDDEKVQDKSEAFAGDVQLCSSQSEQLMPGIETESKGDEASRNVGSPVISSPPSCKKPERAECDEDESDEDEPDKDGLLQEKFNDEQGSNSPTEEGEVNEEEHNEDDSGNDGSDQSDTTDHESDDDHTETSAKSESILKEPIWSLTPANNVAVGALEEVFNEGVFFTSPYDQCIKYGQDAPHGIQKADTLGYFFKVALAHRWSYKNVAWNIGLIQKGQEVYGPVVNDIPLGFVDSELSGELAETSMKIYTHEHSGALMLQAVGDTIVVNGATVRALDSAYLGLRKNVVLVGGMVYIVEILITERPQAQQYAAARDRLNEEAGLTVPWTSCNGILLSDDRQIENLFRGKTFLRRGAYGHVWQGVHPGKGTALACKVVIIDGDEAQYEELKNEVKLLRRGWNKRGICQLLEVKDMLHEGEKLDSKSCLEVELITMAGQTFTNVNFDTTFDWWDKIRYFQDLASGLGWIHRAGFLHRDINEDNAIIVQDLKSGKLVAQLIDFGKTCHGLGSDDAEIGNVKFLPEEQAVDDGHYEAGKMKYYTWGLDIYMLGGLIVRSFFKPLVSQTDLHDLVEYAELLRDLQFNAEGPKALRELVAEMLAYEEGHRPHITRILGAKVFEDFAQ